MTIKTLGDPLLAKDESGRPRNRIATVFPRSRIIVTLPGIHATQRLAQIDYRNERRAVEGLAPLTSDEEDEEMMSAVDLVLEDDTVLIRPDPCNMPLAFEADELLQEVVSKRKIKFLHAKEPQVGDAIRRRGERWRIAPLPRSIEEMRRMIAGSKIAIGGRDIYFYNNTTGTRLLTFAAFQSLGQLDDEGLGSHLAEIRTHCTHHNRMGNPEVAFFGLRENHLADRFAAVEIPAGNPTGLRAAFGQMLSMFRDAVLPNFRQDDLDSAEWRARMFAELIGLSDREASEEALLGLSAEFFMQIEWLPGACIEEGELLLDPLYDEEAGGVTQERRLCDERARGFIFNFIRDYGDLEYVNIGRVVGRISHQTDVPKPRAVYLAEVKQQGVPRTILRIIRMQKWGVVEHLNEGKDLLAALVESEEYTEYILDRRLGCRQLGMNLCPRVTSRKVGERYWGRNGRYHGTWLWSPYFERDYVPGLATDKIPTCRFENSDYANRFAYLLGRAAAVNLIVGRTDVRNEVIFDHGDELVVEGPNGLPADIVVADHTGTFGNYRQDLSDLLPAYARCINRRSRSVADPKSFEEAFLAGLVERYTQVRQEYAKRRRAFDTLFKHLRRDEGGSFGFRWECVLRRLDSTDPVRLADRLRQQFGQVAA